MDRHLSFACTGCVLPLLVALPAFAQIEQLPAPPPGVEVTTEFGRQFCTVPGLNNLPYTGNPASPAFGRGSVHEPFRIARTEVSSADFLDFFNVYTTHPNDPSIVALRPLVGSSDPVWGGILDTSYSGPGERYRLETFSDGHIPVTGLSWRMAAVFCNWLNNGRSNDPSLLWTGAYDVHTFGQTPDGHFTDQLIHSPGAQVYLPSWDQWLVAAHYDPHRYGPNTPGWWRYSITSDAAPLPGLPGYGGQSSVGMGLLEPLLTGYTNVQSPWGLFDTSGGASEWTESSYYGINEFRMFDGSNAGSLDAGIEDDQIDFPGAGLPWLSYGTGIRLAAPLPAPSTTILCAVSIACSLFRRQRCVH